MYISKYILLSRTQQPQGPYFQCVCVCDRERVCVRVCMCVYEDPLSLYRVLHIFYRALLVCVCAYICENDESMREESLVYKRVVYVCAYVSVCVYVCVHGKSGVWASCAFALSMLLCQSFKYCKKSRINYAEEPYRICTRALYICKESYRIRKRALWNTPKSPIHVWTRDELAI